MRRKRESLLRRLRRERGLRLSELALLVGVNISVLSEWERGNQIPSDERLEQLAELYGVPFEELKREVQKYAEKRRAEITAKIRRSLQLRGESDL